MILFIFQSVLDWPFQISSIYSKDSQEVEYFHEVECTGGDWINPPIRIEFRGLVLCEVSTRLARSFSQEPTLDSMIETCKKREEK